MDEKRYASKNKVLESRLRWAEAERKQISPFIPVYGMFSAASWIVAGGYLFAIVNRMSQEGVSVRTAIAGAIALAGGMGAYFVQTYTGKLQRELGGIEERIDQCKEEKDKLQREALRC